jgi:hypothetical protein
MPPTWAKASDWWGGRGLRVLPLVSGGRFCHRFHAQQGIPQHPPVSGVEGNTARETVVFTCLIIIPATQRNLVQHHIVIGSYFGMARPRLLRRRGVHLLTRYYTLKGGMSSSV